MIRLKNIKLPKNTKPLKNIKKEINYAAAHAGDTRDEGVYRKDLVYTIREANDVGLDEYVNYWRKIDPPSEDILDIPMYIGANSGLYSREDDFDQPLCNIASRLGYDILIFTRMVGEFQIVTEIYDVRDRNKSFSSLIFTS